MAPELKIEISLNHISNHRPILFITASTHVPGRRCAIQGPRTLLFLCVRSLFCCAVRFCNHLAEEETFSYTFLHKCCYNKTGVNMKKVEIRYLQTGTLANSEHKDETLHNAAFHLGLYSLQR